MDVRAKFRRDKRQAPWDRWTLRAGKPWITFCLGISDQQCTLRLWKVLLPAPPLRLTDHRRRMVSTSVLPERRRTYMRSVGHPDSGGGFTKKSV